MYLLYMWYFYIKLFYIKDKLFDIRCLKDINVLLEIKKLRKVNGEYKNIQYATTK